MLPQGTVAAYPPTLIDEWAGPDPGIPDHMENYPDTPASSFNSTSDFSFQTWEAESGKALWWKFVPPRSGLVRLDVTLSQSNGSVRLETWNDVRKYQWTSGNYERDFSIGVIKDQPVWIAVIVDGSTNNSGVILRISGYAPETTVLPAGTATRSIGYTHASVDTDYTRSFPYNTRYRSHRFRNSYISHPGDLSIEKEMLWRSGGRKIFDEPWYTGPTQLGVDWWCELSGLTSGSGSLFAGAGKLAPSPPPRFGNTGDFQLPYAVEFNPSTSVPGTFTGIVAPVGPATEADIPESFMFFGLPGEVPNYLDPFNGGVHAFLQVFTGDDLGPIPVGGTPSGWHYWRSWAWEGRYEGPSVQPNQYNFSLAYVPFPYNVYGSFQSPMAWIEPYNVLFELEWMFEPSSYDLIKSDWSSRGVSDFQMVGFEYNFDHTIPSPVDWVIDWNNNTAHPGFSTTTPVTPGELETSLRLIDEDQTVPWRYPGSLDGGMATPADLMAGVTGPNIDTTAPAWQSIPSPLLSQVASRETFWTNPQTLEIMTKPTDFAAMSGGNYWNLAVRVTFNHPEYVNFDTYLPELPDPFGDITGAFDLTRARFT